MPGLHNLGNTCFLNSALQLLAQADVLVDALAAGAPAGWGDALLQALGETLPRVRGGSGSGSGAAPVHPGDLHRAFIALQPGYSGHSQEDGAEALLRLLDHVATLFAARGAPPHRLEELFAFRTVGMVRCGACSAVSRAVSHEPVLCLPLATDTGATSLAGALAALEAEQHLQDAGGWVCEACGARGSPHQALRLSGPGPRYAFLSFKRFTGGAAAGLLRKDDTPVQVPQTADLAGSRYVLRGAILHGGGLQGGHYVHFGRPRAAALAAAADAAAAAADGWVMHNDASEHGLPADEAATLLRGAYVVLYERVATAAAAAAPAAPAAAAAPP